MNHLPVHVARWIGGGGVTMGEEEEAQTTSRTIGGVIMHSGSRGVGEAGGAGKIIPGQDAVRGLRGQNGGNSLENPDGGGGISGGASANAQSAPRKSGGGANAQAAEMPAGASIGDSAPLGGKRDEKN